MPSTRPGSSVPPQIPGYLIPNDAAHQLKQEVASLLGRDNLRFPGAQPVSFAREHLAELQRMEYFLCEKTDGVRCLLFLHWRDNGQALEPVTFLIDRKNNYYEVTPPLRFPYYQSPSNPEQFLFATILDGELVHDVDREDSDTSPRLIYYVFDCLAVDNQNVTGRPLDKRLGRLKEYVLKPYHNRPRQQPFEVKEKQVYPPYHVRNMFDNVLPNLQHGNDGLIFTCKNTKYEFGTDRHILKWKPPHENTIDFKLRLGDFPLFDPEDGEEGLIPDYDAMPTRFQLLVFHGKDHGRSDYRPFEHDLHITEPEWEMLKSLNQRLDGRIIECYRDAAGHWKFKREDDGMPRWRDDKPDANHIQTVNSVLESIQDPVTEQDLLDAEPQVRDAVRGLRKAEEERMKRQHAQWQQEQIDRDAKKRKFSEVNGH
ncbi:mRNA capping enzyme, alpha subunit [Trematosphaeria pertusa]|uniref:mRNA-capping enzyme subunit alpha n=1 Tax=Trematosphaeria pertusa TaxID=390896 RepID=A0A6A6IDD4_9PLEO|nr:mRNA capping enzyme, alpha subunit [Trematosphaeria pertusa]KAF2248219.1 mRNA capping enzyme, alpha subunit [Trematosphaeria pertusa]